MKRADDSQASERDAMWTEYDFNQGVRGATAARYQQGVNVVVVDPDVRDVFPDSAAVNRVLRALAPTGCMGRRKVLRSGARTQCCGG